MQAESAAYKIEDLHEVLFELLVKFDAVCRKHDIKYSIGFGTMLGAVRHKGFIPWDDDVDILITRPEYKKLCKIASSEFIGDYFFQTVLTEKGYPYNTTRIRKNNTAMIFEKWRSAGFHQGIYIDIIPLDNIPNYKIKAMIQRMEIIILTPFRFVRNKNVFFAGGKNIPLCVKRMMYAILKHVPFDSIYQMETAVEKKYENITCNKIGFLGEGNLFLKKWYPVEPISSYTMKEFIDMPFKDTKFMCSKYYKELLHQWYGDYMVLPPKEDRSIYHQPIFFSKEDSYNNFIKNNYGGK